MDKINACHGFEKTQYMRWLFMCVPLLGIFLAWLYFSDFFRLSNNILSPDQVLNNNTFIQEVPSPNKDDTVRRRSIAFYVNWDDNSLFSLKEHIDDIDILMPEWLHLEVTDGSFKVDDSAPGRQKETADFIRFKKPELQIIPLINNFSSLTNDWDGENLSLVLRNPKARTILIKNLFQYVQKNNFSGINIDFENIDKDHQKDLTLFMKELFEVFHPLQLVVSQDIPLVSGEVFEVKESQEFVDFFVLMAYDEHSVGADLPGPIASERWYSNALVKRFEELSSQKYVVAIGGYGYDWEGEKLSGSTVTFQNIVRLIKRKQIGISFDSRLLNPVFDYLDEHGIKHSVWFLDATTAFNQIIIAEKLGGSAGYALWRLGSEDNGFWTVMRNRKKLDQNVAESLNQSIGGYKREIFYDKNSGLITNEKITASSLQK